MIAGRSKGCTDFSELVINDIDTLEVDETFNIVVDSSVANITIIDDDGMQIIFYSMDIFHLIPNVIEFMTYKKLCLNYVFFHVKTSLLTNFILFYFLF